MMGQLMGECLCRSVTIVVDGEHDAAVGACHCRMCQAWSGALYATFAAKAAAVTVTGEVARYQSSEFAERAFCPRCGSHLWFRFTGEADAHYELMPGMFAEAVDFPMTSEIYSDRAPGYARLAGDHSRTTRADHEARSLFIEGDTP